MTENQKEDIVDPEILDRRGEYMTTIFTINTRTALVMASALSLNTDGEPRALISNFDNFFDLGPLNMGVAVLGPDAIGDRSVKSLMEEFKCLVKPEDTRINVAGISQLLLAFLRRYYLKHFGSSGPEMKLIVGGYDRDGRTGVSQVYVHKDMVDRTDYSSGIRVYGDTYGIERLKVFFINSAG